MRLFAVLAFTGYLFTVATCITLKYRADDTITVYADGVELAENTDLMTTHSLTLPGDTQVLGIELYNGRFLAGFIAGLSTGVVTDSSWKCIDAADAGAPSDDDDSWKSAGYDDSAWPDAVEKWANEIGGSPRDPPNAYGLTPAIDSSAKWIYVATRVDYQTVYCRKTIGTTCPDPEPVCVNGRRVCECDDGYTGDDCSVPVATGYNCGDNNPCDPLLVPHQYYYAHENESYFVQCSQWRQCWVMPCAPGTKWSQAAFTCVHA